jgi:hypothetical protein
MLPRDLIALEFKPVGLKEGTAKQDAINIFSHSRSRLLREGFRDEDMVRRLASYMNKRRDGRDGYDICKGRSSMAL